MEVESFLRSIYSLATASLIMLLGLCGIYKAAVVVRRQYSAGDVTQFPFLVRMLRLPIFDAGVLLSLASVVIFMARVSVPPLPLNVQLTSAAWDAFNSGNYTLAITKATECINTFENQAVIEQKVLKSSNSQLPPTGAVHSETKRLILSHGVLNDVATSYFILGQALERQNRIKEAKEAYKKAQVFPYARAWDPKGWLWSPADAAGGRLATLS